MKFANKKQWKENKKQKSSVYGRKGKRLIFKYAKKWANTMEKEIKKGKSLESIVESSIPKGFNMSGASHWCALSLLCFTWIHGKELESYWNSK